MRSIIFIFLSLVLFSCSHTNCPPSVFDNEVTIAGIDPALCPCCGGYMLAMENDSTIYRINDWSEQVNEVLMQADFPITAWVDWEFLNECADYTFIKVTDICIE